MPQRAADQRFSSSRHVSAGRAARPRRGGSASQAIRAWTSAATAAASSTVACASGTRSSSVPNAGCGRSSHHQRRALGHRARCRPPRQRLGERLPRADRRRDPLARQLLADLRADRGHAGVAPVVERRVRGQRGDQRAARCAARCRPRATGRPRRPRRGPAARRRAGRRATSPYSPSVSVVALAAVQLAERGGERVDARRRRAGRPAPRRQPGRAARRRARRSPPARVPRRRQAELELRGRHLELEPRVARPARSTSAARGSRSSVSRVEQHQLLLEPDRERLGRVEGARRSAAVGIGSAVIG